MLAERLCCYPLLNTYCLCLFCATLTDATLVQRDVAASNLNGDSGTHCGVVLRCAGDGHGAVLNRGEHTVLTDGGQCGIVHAPGHVGLGDVGRSEHSAQLIAGTHGILTTSGGGNGDSQAAGSGMRDDIHRRVGGLVRATILLIEQ